MGSSAETPRASRTAAVRAVIVAAAMLAVASCGAPVIERHQVRVHTSLTPYAGEEQGLRYLIYVPGRDSGTTPAPGWPLIIFLHGAFESGEDVATVARHGLPGRVESGKDLPFAIVSPQNRLFGREWSADRIIRLLDDVVRDHPIDRDRVYLTGMSMGGLGTWRTAIAYPRRFAAIAPACAFGDPAEIRGIAHLPVWAYHGADDFIVPARKGRAMVDAHRAGGGRARWTLEPGAGHGDCGNFYWRDDLYQWLLIHRRSAHPPSSARPDSGASSCIAPPSLNRRSRPSGRLAVRLDAGSMSIAR